MGITRRFTFTSLITWPPMLCLDGVFVALVWQQVLAKEHLIQVQGCFRWSLALAVWIIYVIDRLLDAWRVPSAQHSLRHAFVHRHWRLLCMVFLPLASLCLVWLALWHLPQTALLQGLIMGGLTCCYLAVHSAESQSRLQSLLFFLPAMLISSAAASLTAGRLQSLLILLVAGLGCFWFKYRASPRWKQVLPKETIAALLFALGAALSSHAWLVDAHSLLCSSTLTAAGLFVLNIVTIAHAELVHGQADASSREVCIRWSEQACWVLSLVIVLFQLWVWQRAGDSAAAFSAASMMSVCLLTCLRLQRHRTSPEAIRGLADLALLLPVFI